jgi:hypothetical protein
VGRFKLRFRRSIRLTKGVRLNFGKRGVSVTGGTRGAHHTVHSSGRRTTSVGIPGTGISWQRIDSPRASTPRMTPSDRELIDQVQNELVRKER